MKKIPSVMRLRAELLRSIDTLESGTGLSRDRLKVILRHRRQALSLAAGFAVALAGVLFLSGSDEPQAPSAAQTDGRTVAEQDAQANSLPIPKVDIQKDGPLLDGQRVSLPEARGMVSYAVPVPPVDGASGGLTAIWIDRFDQIAFVWDTDLRMYLGASEESENVAAQKFADKAENDHSQVAPWVLTHVGGHTALGVEGNESVPSSLTFQHGTVDVQFVGPNQSLSELIGIAEAMVFLPSE